MLTGNEPVSAGNLKAALGGYGRPLSAYIASGHADGDRIELTGGGSEDFICESGAVKCMKDGIYSVYVSVHMESSASANQESSAFISVAISGSYSAKIPITSFQRKTSDWKFNKTDSSCFVAHLAKGDGLKAAGSNSNTRTYVSLSIVRVG